MRKIEILIIDDHEIVKQGVINRVKSCFSEGAVICYFSFTIRNAIATINQHNIDIIISDLEFENSSEIDGFGLLLKLKEIQPEVKSIALTHFHSYRIMKKALDAGFNSFLDKSCSGEDFCDTLLNVVNNDFSEVYNSQSMKKLRKKKNVFYKNIFSNSLGGLSDLSKRELELVSLTSKSTDKFELSNYMGISPATVDTHIKNTLLKLQLNNRKELALFASEFSEEIEKLIKFNI